MKKAKKLIALLCVVLICAQMFTMMASAAYPTLMWGSNNDEVKMLQTMLNRVNSAGLDVDGRYYTLTTNAVFDFKRDVLGENNVNGQFYGSYWTKLINKYKVKVQLSKGCYGDDVRMLQRMLNKVMNSGLSVDGDFGNLTKNAVIAFQKQAFQNKPSEWDGIVGSKTWEKLFSYYFG